MGTRVECFDAVEVGVGGSGADGTGFVTTVG